MKSKSIKALTQEVLTDDVEQQLAYLRAAFEDNYDFPEAIMTAIRNIAEVRGISHLANTSELNRENLYRVLSGSTYPRIDTFFKIINALGMRLTVEGKGKTG
ncbi:MAG: putative addiction module antidote protein [Bacteriovoracaceae bacterium]|nr:putative addiction module antidote protein [Bacteriovoracaceae bacterium]